MAYVKTVWVNREVERPRTYVLTNNADGTVTLTPSEGQIFQAGTPIEATTMNKIEDQLEATDNALGTKLDLTGGTLTGPLTGTVINATTELQENGVGLSTKYQAKGSYAPTGNYVTYTSDPNGVYLNLGTHNGEIYQLFLTSAQPGVGGTGYRRIWIQTDA